METVMLALDLDKVCRVCLLDSDSMFSIYSKLFDQNSNEKMPTISEILVNISNIKIQEDDTLPNMICTNCIDSAHSSYKFQLLCNKSQSILESYLEHIKDLEVTEISIAKDNHPDNMENKSEDTVTETVNSNDSECSNLMLKDNLTPDDLEFINDDYLISDQSKNTDENDECDDLKNCFPLGEDTVDQLIKDNFRVENLELISPKMEFNLNLTDQDEDTISSTLEKSSKDLPSMNYYKNNKDGALSFDCNVCNKSFKFANSLRIHLKTHDEKKPYLCSDCKKGFKAYASLMHHVRSHSDEQPFECKECGKKYKQSGTLTAHMRIHTGSKPYLCSICGRGFRQGPDLTYHMRTHTKEKPYMCNVCGKTMTMQCHLVQHMRSHTGEKPFKCSICDKAFPSSTRLKRHSIVHTTLKPYKCTICDKTFNRSSSLKVHTKIHSGVKSHKCPICNKSFLWAHSLRSHILTHSKQTKTKRSDLVKVHDDSLVKFTTMTIYSDDKSPGNESFAIFSNGDVGDGNESFQICALANEDECDGVETFTLYSEDTESGQVTSATNSIQLPTVSL